MTAFLSGVSCGSGTPTPTQQAEVGAYEAAMLACVAQAPTRFDADQCRARVRAAYREAGAPVGGEP